MGTFHVESPSVLWSSPSGEYIISGSEDGHAYVWRTNNLHTKSNLLNLNKQKNNSYESFDGTASASMHAPQFASRFPHVAPHAVNVYLSICRSRHLVSLYMQQRAKRLTSRCR